MTVDGHRNRATGKKNELFVIGFIKLEKVLAVGDRGMTKSNQTTAQSLCVILATPVNF